MLVQVKQLLYWKTEHGNADNCQDAPSYNDGQGLFAVADGAGTSLFPALWARILAQHFVTTPLMSDDPFEVEWWVRLAQAEYKQKVPNIPKVGAWNVVQKVRNQGSDSTLATLRITRVDAATAEATLLVFGDSCVLIGDPEKETVSSFILQKPGEFDRAPICVPSDLKYFNRAFHRCQTTDITLNVDTQIILATDAVSRWILGRGEMADVWTAFQEVYQCSENDWPTLVNAKRQYKEMVNDDSTALALTFYADGAEIGTPLDYVKGHTQEVIAQRQKAFEDAASGDNKELLAIAYGDGIDLRSVTTTPPIEEIDITYAHKVADGLKEVLRVFRLAQNSPDLVRKVKPVWDKYGHLLQDEPCAANLCETLRNNGVIRPTPVPPVVVSPMQTSTPTTPPIQTSVHTPPHIPMLGNIPKLPSGSATPAAFPGKDEQDFDLGNAETVRMPRSRIGPTPTVNTLDQQKQRDLESELAQKQRAADFFSAWYEKNEEKIIAAYEEILRERDQETLAHLDPTDRQTIERMLQRRKALTKFNAVLQQGANPAALLRAYHAIKQTDPTLTLPKSSQELLRLAQEFMNAWGTTDLYLLAKAYKNINQSGFKVHFTHEEMTRINQAESTLRKHKHDLEHIIIARVGNDTISLKSFVSIYIIKLLYIRYIGSQPLSNSPAEATELSLAINNLNQQLAADDFPVLVLDEFINSLLVREGIKAAASDYLEQQITTRRQQLVDDLQRYEESQPDPLFRQQELGVRDLKNFAWIAIAPEMFASYLENQKKTLWPRFANPKKSVLDDWLKEKKEAEKNTIFFGENERYAYTDRIKKQTSLKHYIATYIYHSSS